MLTTVQRRKLQYFGHVVHARNLCTGILDGRIDGERKCGKPRRRWTEEVKDWTNRTVAFGVIASGVEMERVGALRHSEMTKEFNNNNNNIPPRTTQWPRTGLFRVKVIPVDKGATYISVCIALRLY